ncbi:2-dehydro-3-deoxy-6-phosphogalactonate aldolase [Burkholderia sp. Nafp2/4-1b]|uniref:2-dehydro-3-deoxy-6-phosphogalactonate aldolase n=1 Tax=Burkholderia sp. Nafp2/4-1b TaxID=2116686 RepID=UPI000EF96DBD|nr:2-dehydro-3-deoxy-6-phosphogalactonate aldolase [Burkholderia sp. Nafp2/4-1b]RKU00073.1 2-dehydro-3-deoxy-6-phosphogalactonate aldolase [Burkholderia sp. Nafp2/4-1b]
MPNVARFEALVSQCPLVAILRGVRPDEVVEIAGALIDNGIRMLEVPLNSPDPFTSIRRLADAFGASALIGAGTVTSIHDVERVADAGGALVVSPNIAPMIVRVSVAAGLVTLPGVATPSEAFSALDAGAHGVKAFPADQIGCKGLQAWLTVLPPSTRVFAVGGIDEHSIPKYRAAGIGAFGVGGTLYKPGFTAADVGLRAKMLKGACMTA